MAIAGLSSVCKPRFSLRPRPLFHCLSKASLGAVAAIQTLDDTDSILKHTISNTDTSHSQGTFKFHLFFTYSLRFSIFLRAVIFDMFRCMRACVIVDTSNTAKPEWKKLNSKELGISTSMIDRPTRKVLNGLKKKGEIWLLIWELHCVAL